MLSIVVRFKEQDATVRYLPKKVRLQQIMDRYQVTPFTVAPAGPVRTVVNLAPATIKAWSHVPKAEKKDDKTIELMVQWTPKPGTSMVSKPSFTVTGLTEHGYRLGQAFQAVEKQANSYVARLEPLGSPKSPRVELPVRYVAKVKDKTGKEQDIKGQLGILIHHRKSQVVNAGSEAPPALIAGVLDIELGHLCTQKGCVAHFNQSLQDIRGLAGIRPYPSLKTPRAGLYLRAGQAVDIAALRQTMRRRGIEIKSMVPREVESYLLHVDLVRWQDAKTSQVSQCQVCRDHAVQAIKSLPWAQTNKIAGGGITVQPSGQPNLVGLLDTLAKNDIAPAAVWLAPAGVSIPQPSAPRKAVPAVVSTALWSVSHPEIEIDLGHTPSTGILGLVRKQKWASHVELAQKQGRTTALIRIQDRNHALLTPLLTELRARGQSPGAIRLTGFNDIRVIMEFAHVCGEVEYSKPPKPKKGSKTKSDKAKSDKTKPSKAKKTAKKKKPFVPKPLRPAKTSNGRQAIEAALARVPWLKEAVFHPYHTKPEFKGPRKLMLALKTNGKAEARLDQLVDALTRAGFPPKTIAVSRLFPGIPFGQPLPTDLILKNLAGQNISLSAFRQPKRPLVVAFVALNCTPKYKKYQHDPLLYVPFKNTIDQFKDRADFVAISANPKDKYSDVQDVLKAAGIDIPVLHDATGQVRAVFNNQVAPPPHIFVFDEEGLLRYAGDPHDQWEKPLKIKDKYLERALPLVIAKKFKKNDAVFYNKALCNCAEPHCKCPKCGCGATCRCAIKHCGTGFK